MNKKGILKFSVISIFILALIVAWLVFGERGFFDLYHKEKERLALIGRIKELERKNQDLREKIDRLRSDKEYIESVARKELGLVKDNEILYRFVRKDEMKKKNKESGEP